MGMLVFVYIVVWIGCLILVFKLFKWLMHGLPLRILTRRRKEKMDGLMRRHDFSPDYAREDHTLAIEIAGRRFLILDWDDERARLIEADEIEQITKGNQGEYYITVETNDLDHPVSTLRFGGDETERDKWYARIRTVWQGEPKSAA